MRPPIADPDLLGRFKSALVAIYGDRLDRAVLYGSRARGEADDGSDYDIAVFLRSMPDGAVEQRRLAELAGAFLDSTGAFVEAFAFPADAIGRRTPLMHEIRKDGRAL